MMVSRPDCWPLTVAVIVMTSCQSDSRQSHYRDVNSLSSARLELLLSQPSGDLQIIFSSQKKVSSRKQNVPNFQGEIGDLILTFGGTI